MLVRRKGLAADSRLCTYVGYTEVIPNGVCGDRRVKCGRQHRVSSNGFGLISRVIHTYNWPVLHPNARPLRALRRGAHAARNRMSLR